MPTFTHRTVAGDVDFALRKRGGTWHYDFFIKGQRQRGSTKTIDQKRARVLAEREIERSLNAGAATLTLAAAVTRYLDERWPDVYERMNNSTYSDVKARLGSLTKAQGEKFVTVAADEVAAIIQSWIDRRKNEGKSAVTLGNDQRCVSRMFSWLRTRKAVQWPFNPAQRARLNGSANNGDVRGLDIPRAEVNVKPPADEADIAKLLRMAKNAPILPALVLMQSGYRSTGCVRTTWKDVNLGSKPTAVVPIEKGRTRIIPLSPWAAGLLRSWRRKHADDHFIYPFSLDQFHEDLKRLRRVHGLPESLTLGSLRRLTYSRLYEAGVSPQLAAKIMGSSISVAMKHYVDLETLSAHDAVRVLRPAKPSQKPSQSKSNKKRSKRAKH